MKLTGADLKAKYLGAMVGSALGDAIGEVAFWNRQRERLRVAVEGLEQLRYTDDTAMAIGLAESILEKRHIDQQHLGDTFSRNFFREPGRGYAAGPPTIFSLVRSSGISYVEAARRLFGGEGSLGNGAAMRIAPVGLVFHGSEDLYQAAAASAEVTHAHPVGMDGAAILAWAIGQAVELNPNRGFSSPAFVRGLIDVSRTERNRSKLEQVRALIEDEIPPPIAADQLGRSVAVDESMPFAIYSFLRYPQSFEECLFCATLHGGDRDTLGAMAGALSGAYLGIEAIPSPWRQKLENRDLIEGLAASLYELTLQGGGLKSASP
ncbi:MAG: ADP-ribosylglycohydrolase family protein [candidate division NC10 bacterium]|nr:ADP-ribosylglycohydrolase family protein [candidate division NC10 bacterium]